MNIEIFDGKESLDITGFTETGKNLIDAIVRAVRATQSVLIRELPNELVMTSAQFEDLMNQKGTVSYMSSVNGIDDPMFEGMVKKAYIFYTPMNAMDVRVKDSEAKTLKENKL